MPGPRVVCLPSPPAAEEFLAAKVQELTASEGLPDPPALVVVPSRSVREGLVQALLRRQPAWVGVEVRTLQGVALAVLQQAGLAFWPREPLFFVVVSRVAQAFCERYPFLQLLSPLEKVQPLASTVRDLLDAGFTAEHLEAACELVAGEVKESVGQRATALLQVAAAVDEAFRAGGVFRRNDALRLATDLLKRQGASLWPLRPLLVYGFADVTGLAADFLEALLALSSGEAVLVQPPDPVNPEFAAGEEFLRRLQQRLPTAKEEASCGQPQLPQLCLWQAPELEAEVRFLAEDIKKQLAAGIKPERIGVVARTLEPYALAIRKHFSALGVPFSAYQPAPTPRPLIFRLLSLLELAARGAQAAVSHLLAAMPRGEGQARALALALGRLAGAVGARTVGQLVERAHGVLQEQGEAASWSALSGEALGTWLARLQAVLAAPGEGEDGTSFGQNLQVLAALCDPSQEGTGFLAEALDAVEEQVGGFPLSRQERCFLLGEELRRKLAEPLGGNGGGVAVLSAMEARFRTFDRLYIVGLQRDVFPRLPREDPLLPDHVRHKLAVLFPDIPLAERGASEERYLFGLLLASAPWVWLSWPAYDPEGRPLARSPFVDELLVAYPSLQPQRAPGRETLIWGESLRPAPAGEWAVYAGLSDDRQAWLSLFKVALEEARSEVGKELAVGAAAVARARERVLSEWAPPPWEAEKRALSPYLGFLGPCPWVEEETTLSAVTTMETYAQCPWKTFLERVLRLSNLYAGEAEGAGLSPRLVGDVVHGVLDAILKAHVQEQKREREKGEESQGRALRWPPAQELDRMLLAVTAERLRRVGVVYPGLALALMAAAKPFLEVARRLLVEVGLGTVVAGEGSGWIGTEGRKPVWHFRFDAAVEREGVPVLLDFKTGSPEPYLRLKSDPQARVRRGELLQGAVYAAATHAIGCYVFLHPDWDGEKVFPIIFSPALGKTLLATFHAFFVRAQAGVFFPRLFDPVAKTEPDACQRCQVRLACSRGDSGVRRRLERWGESIPAGGGLAELAWRHWWLSKET